MRFTSLDFFKNLYFLDFKLTKIPERLFEGESPDVNFQFILRKIPNPNIKWEIDFFKYLKKPRCNNFFSKAYNFTKLNFKNFIPYFIQNNFY